MALKPTEAAIRVLCNSTIDGNHVKLPPEKLAPDLYKEVKKLLELIGGKWKGHSVQAFVFKEDPTELVTALRNGEAKDLKKEHQFFSTPAALAHRMVSFVQLMPGMRVLEPSAGSGAIINAIQEVHGKNHVIDCFENMPTNQMQLQKYRNVQFLGSDFLQRKITGTYDVIIANPPFNKNQDIDHILHMYDALKTNGKLVTLASLSWTFGSQKKQVAFREWLNEVGAYQEELPEGTFKESGTNIRTMLLVIDKLETVATVNEIEDVPVRACRECRCTENNACVHPEYGPCWWVEEDLCSHCDSKFKKNDTGGSAALVTALRNNKKSPTNTPNMQKIIVPVSPLLAVLKKVKEVVSKHPIIEVLSNILIKVRRADVQIIATDLMVTVIGAIEVVNDCDYGYEYLLPFEFFLGLMNNINSTDITLEFLSAGPKNEIVYSAVVTTLTDNVIIDSLSDTVDFPKLPEFPQENSVGIAGDFIEWLNKSLDTASKDELRPAMQSVFVNLTNNGLAMASTNAHLLVEKTFITESDRTTALLVNPKIAKALKGFKHTSISWSDTHIAFVSDSITLIGTIQDEKFPNYTAVFPSPSENPLRVSPKELTAVLEKVSLTKKPCTIWLKREIGIIVIESEDIDFRRKITVRIPGDYNGYCERLIIDPQQMLRLLGQIDYVQISLSIQAPDKAVVITSDSDDTYRSLIMPLL